uniref:Uncharacterized protein n=1 Tax=Lepeophtheirus salmonis TaxID=72036 RepID=A0A0K2U8Q3_LEPSM
MVRSWDFKCFLFVEGKIKYNKLHFGCRKITNTFNHRSFSF